MQKWLQNVINSIISSAVTETVPEPETEIFCQNHGELKPQ